MYKSLLQKLLFVYGLLLTPAYGQLYPSTGPVKILNIWDDGEYPRGNTLLYVSIDPYINPANCSDAEYFYIGFFAVDLRRRMISAKMSGEEYTFRVDPSNCDSTYDRPIIRAITH